MSRTEAEGLKQVGHVLAIGHIDAALNAAKAKALQRIGDIRIGLRRPLGVMLLGVGDHQIKRDGKHQLAGSAAIFLSG